MNLSQRILIVENLEPLQKQYKVGLELANLEADTASKLEDALAAIENRTYTIIMVDLMLNDPVDTKLDGLPILERVRDLGEGTKTIVISGQTSIETALETQKAYAGSDYVEKTKILNEGMDYLINKITDLLKNAEIKLYGPYKSVAPVLAGGYARERNWSDQFLNGLKSKGGIPGLEKFLTKLGNPLVPLLPEKDVTSPLQIKPDLGVATGHFWSKGKGIGVQLVIGNEDRMADLNRYLSDNHLDKQSALHKADASGLVGYVFQLGNDVPRERFLSKLPPDPLAEK